MIESPMVLTAVILAIAALAFWLDRHVRLLSTLGASLLALILGALVSNLGLVAPTSPVYDVGTGVVTSLAIAWLILAVDVRDLKRAGGTMTAAFLIAVAGTAVGAVVAGLLFAGVFGEDTWRVAGTMAGTYSGGSLNFVAVGRGVGLPESLFAGATAADNVTTSLWLGASLMLPLWLRRFYPAPIPGEETGGASSGHAEGAGAGTAPAAPGHGSPGQAAPNGAGAPVDPQEEARLAALHPFFRRVPLSSLDLAVLVAAGFGLVLAAEFVGSVVPAIPSVLWLTTLALLVGNTIYKNPPGALQLGNVALHVFFVVIGIYSRIAEIAAVGVEIFLFTLVVVGVHGLVLYLPGKLLRFDLGTLSVASQAAIGGPGSAIAVAAARRWSPLVLPGIIVGLLGYAVGNYVGFAVAYGLRGLGVGL